MSYLYGTSIVSGAYHYGIGGLGILPANIPSFGEYGGSILYNDIYFPDDIGKEFRAVLETLPVSGDLFLYENGSFIYTPITTGEFYFVYRLYVDGVDLGSATVYLSVGTKIVSGNAVLDSIASGGLISALSPTIAGGVIIADMTVTGIMLLNQGTLSGDFIINEIAVVGGVVSIQSLMTGSVDIAAIDAAGDFPDALAMTSADYKQMYTWISELAKIHGLVLGAALQVSQTQRSAGDVLQLITGGPDTIVVTRQ